MADVKTDYSTGLVSCWLSDSSGLTTDLVTATGNDLTNVNTVTSTTGKNGDAGDFELSSGQLLKITDANFTNLNPTSAISIAAWIKIESVSASIQTIASLYRLDDAGNDQFPYKFFFTNGKLQCYFWDGTNFPTPTVTWSPSDRDWETIV